MCISTVVLYGSYIFTVSVSVRLASDQAALARTFGNRSSRAARMVFAVSATNMTSYRGKKPQRATNTTVRGLR